MVITPVHVPIRSSSKRGHRALCEKTVTAVPVATPKPTGPIVAHPIIKVLGDVVALEAQKACDGDDLPFRDNAFGNTGGDERHHLIVPIGARRDVA